MTTLTREAARRRYATIALAIPLAVLALLLAAQAALLPLLPDPVASHWGLAGEPDGFSAPWTLPLVTAGAGIVVTLLIGLAPYLADVPPARGGAMSYRLLAALVWAETGFIGTLMIATFVPQIGLDDARDARLPGWWALIGVAIGAVLALLAWRLVVEPPRAGEDPEQPSPIALRASEQAVWLRTASMSGVGIALAVTAAVVTVGAAALAAHADLRVDGAIGGGTLLIIAVALLLIAVLAAGTAFRVRVDGDGLDVRARIGWPRVRIPRDRIRSAAVVDVNPMGEYGGWGWRYSVNSGWGVVLRAGEALRVVRTDGKAFTITVDDAETGAALLNGLIARDAKETGR